MGFRDSFVKIARVCGFITPLVSYGMIFLAIMNAPWFSWYRNALSDLGARASSDLYFNSGLILAGFLEALFSIGLFLNLRGVVGEASAVVLFADSIALMCIGIFPETAGRIHFYVSVAFFLLYPIASILFGVHLLSHGKDRLFGVLSVVMAFICLAIWFLVPWRSMGVTGVAIPEFLSSLVGCVWMIYIAYKYFE
jgi:hypothetical membrane protein